MCLCEPGTGDPGGAAQSGVHAAVPWYVRAFAEIEGICIEDSVIRLAELAKHHARLIWLGGLAPFQYNRVRMKCKSLPGSTLLSRYTNL